MADWWEGFWATYNTVIFGIGVSAMLALSIYVTLSCGLLSLANAAFMGIGAYGSALLTSRLLVSTRATSLGSPSATVPGRACWTALSTSVSR